MPSKQVRLAVSAGVLGVALASTFAAAAHADDTPTTHSSTASRPEVCEGGTVTLVKKDGKVYVRKDDKAVRFTQTQLDETADLGNGVVLEKEGGKVFIVENGKRVEFRTNTDAEIVDLGGDTVMLQKKADKVYVTKNGKQIGVVGPKATQKVDFGGGTVMSEHKDGTVSVIVTRDGDKVRISTTLKTQKNKSTSGGHLKLTCAKDTVSS